MWELVFLSGRWGRTDDAGDFATYNKFVGDAMSRVYDALMEAAKRNGTIDARSTPGWIPVEHADIVSGPRSVEGDEAPSLRDYWQIVTKHKWKIVACFVAAVTITGLIVFSMTPIYTAKTTLLIERKELQVVNIKQVLSESAEAEESSYYESQYQVLRSRSLAAEVIKAQELDQNPDFTTGARANFIAQLCLTPLAWLQGFLPQTAPIVTSPDLSGVDSKLIDTYTGMLEVEPVKRSRIVTIGISAPNPVLAAKIANAHAEGYVRQGFSLRAQANEEARKFLESKLGDLKDRLQTSEDSLNRFRRGKGIISLDDKENIVIDRLADLNRRLTEAEADRIGFEAQARLIRQRDYDSLPAVIANSLIQNLRAQVVQLESEHARLAAQFLPGYPRLAQVKAQLEEMRSRLAQQINSVVEGINSGYFAASDKERALKVRMDKQKSDALALKDASVEYAILAREVDTNKQLYDSVVGRLNEISVTGEIPTSNVSILDRAEIPTRPSKPNKRLNLMLGALLGLMGGLGLALLLEHLNNTLTTPEEVERYLALPNLGLVPELPSSGRSLLAHAPIIRRLVGRKNGNGNSESEVAFYPCDPDQKPVSTFHSFGVANEAYRTLRTGILLSQAEQPPKTILFTSAVHGEGKTATVVNSAISFARMGVRVLLIDADLRRPFCHKILSLRRGLGVGELLSGEIQPLWAIQPTHVANLFFISSGSGTLDPTEFIGSIKMREILSSVRDQYDYILVDSPPVLAVSDALLLSTMVDGVVVVIGGRGTSRDTVKHACSRLHYAHAKILGTMLNRVNTNGNSYADYYDEPSFHAEQRT